MTFSKKLLLLAFTATLITGYIRGSKAIDLPEAISPAKASTEALTEAVQEATEPCVDLGNRRYYCGDDKDLQLKALDQELQAIKSKRITAFVTSYSRKDSCHNPSGDKCLTAAGRDTKAGVTVACPRSLKLGTKVRIDGFVYTCEDRYSTYLDAKRGLPTFDIFTEDYDAAIKWGIKKMTVEVL